MNQAHSSFKPKILVAPLDWGLGHASRCIPLIQSLISNDLSPVLAGEGHIKALLQQEFPTLPFIDLPGYRIQYSRNKWALPFVLATQIPTILSGIKYENERIPILVKKHGIDGIISDNRYGMYHAGIPSIFITHQLLIKTPFGKQADRLLQKLNYQYINRFTESWVPDLADGSTLAGELSHPPVTPGIPIQYLGPLSRFIYKPSISEKHVLVLLSGPEPQRTIFEKQCLDQLSGYRGEVVLVRGLPGEVDTLKTPPHVQVYNHLPTWELQKQIEMATFVICRCGYSSIMDLAILKKKSILIPTPGQTEQEYLARHLSANNFALCINQNKFKLPAALDLAKNFPYQIQSQFTSHLDVVVKGLHKMLVGRTSDS